MIKIMDNNNIPVNNIKQNLSDTDSKLTSH